MGFRRGYVAIVGVVLITYGLVLNFLGAMASYLHPGTYHQGAMGTPMWCGLAVRVKRAWRFTAFTAIKQTSIMPPVHHQSPNNNTRHCLYKHLPVLPLFTVLYRVFCILCNDGGNQISYFVWTIRYQCQYQLLIINNFTGPFHTNVSTVTLLSI